MSEFSDEHTIFEDLTRGLEDPYVTAFFDDVRTVQREINGNLDFSEQDRIRLMKRLNDNWIYRDEEVTITGEVTMLSEGKSQRVLAEDVPASFRGFNVFQPATVEPASDDYSYHIRMMLMIKTQDGPDLYTLAGIDDLAIEYPFESRDKMEQRLDNELREYREELDEAIFGDGDTTQVIKNLAGFVYESDATRGVDQAAVDALEYYINKAVGFDEQLPYYVTVQDELYKLSENGTAEQTKLDDDLYDIAKVVGVTLKKVAVSSDDKTDYMVPFVVMEHYSSWSNQPNVGFMTDAHNVKSMIPMRDDVDTEIFD